MATGIRLNEDKRMELGRTLLQTVQNDLDSRMSALDDANTIRAMYYGQSGREILPYSGASDIHLPVITDKVETFTPKAKNALTGADPKVRLRRAGNEEFAEDDTRQQEAFLNWVLETDIEGFDEAIEGWIRNSCLDPVSVLKTYWEQKWRDTVEVNKIKSMWRPGDTDITGQVIEAETQKSSLELISEVFGTPPEFVGDDGLLTAEEDDNGSWTLSFIEQRRLFENVRVEFQASEFVDEVEVHAFRRILVRDAVRVDNIEFEDLIVPFRTTNLQEAEHVIHQHWMTVDEIQDKKDSGEWDLTSDDMEMLAKERTRTQQELEKNQQNKEVRDVAVGEDDTLQVPVPGLSPFVGGKVLVFECYVRDDALDNGRPTELIYQLPLALEKVVRVDYLDSVFPHGHRPFSDIKFLPITDRWMGISMGRLLIGIQQQVNITINQVNDSQELINHPFFFYVPATVNLDPAILENVQPGQGIPVADVASVLFPQWTQQPLANLSSGLDPVLLFADRLTTSALSSGSPQVRNAPRTARGTFALLGESNGKIDMYVRRAQKGGWKELIYQIYSLYQYYGPEEKWFYVMGDSNRKRISTKRLRGRYEFMFFGNVINTNPEMMRSLSQQRYGMARQDPLYINDPQAAQNVLRDMLTHMTEGSTNIELMIPKLPAQGAMGMPLSPKMAIQSMSQGIMVQAHPAEDHTAHIDALQKFAESKNFDNIEPGHVSLFTAALQQHMQFQAQAVANAQAERGVGGAEQSVSTDVGLGNMEGGVV